MQNSIKATRLAQHIDQITLATHMRVDRTTIWRWETGQLTPTLEQACALAAYLGTTASALFPRLDFMSDPTSEEVPYP